MKRALKIPVRRVVPALLAGALVACAPTQEGVDQCKDANLTLIELKDAKYTTLPVAEGGLSATLRADIDNKVTAFRTAHAVPIAGCAVAVTRNDQIAYLHADGLADQAANRILTIATPMPIGSISKTLTALGLLVLVDERKLALDEPVLSQMGLQPGVDTGWSDNPTLRQLLAHKGGFKKGYPIWAANAFNDGPSMTAAFPNVPFPSLQPLLVFQGYKGVEDNQVQDQIGTCAYSNVGYSVAGALLDHRSRGTDIVPAQFRGYERFIGRRVARDEQSQEPTMISACLVTDFRTADIKNLARGYAENGSDLSFGDSASVGWGWEGPSGGWAMTIGDLARLMLILQSSAVVAKNTIDNQMRVSNGVLFPADSPADSTRAGLGLELAGDGSWFGKGGDILGYTADMKIWPSANGTSWGVGFLCNQKETGKRLTGCVHDSLVGTTGRCDDTPDNNGNTMALP